MVRDPLAAKKVAEALKIIYDNFKPDGPWDAKPHLGRRFKIVNEEIGWLPMSTGQEVDYDVLGNIQYGVMMPTETQFKEWFKGVDIQGAIKAAGKIK